MHEEFSESEFAFHIPTWKIRSRVSFPPLSLSFFLRLSLEKKTSNNKLSRIRAPAAIPPTPPHRPLRGIVSFEMRTRVHL